MVNFFVSPVLIGYSRVWGVFYEDDDDMENMVDSRATEGEAELLANRLKSRNRKPRRIFDED